MSESPAPKGFDFDAAEKQFSSDGDQSHWALLPQEEPEEIRQIHNEASSYIAPAEKTVHDAKDAERAGDEAAADGRSPLAHYENAARLLAKAERLQEETNMSETEALKEALQQAVESPGVSPADKEALSKALEKLISGQL